MYVCMYVRMKACTHAYEGMYAFFYNQCFFSTQLQCCLTFNEFLMKLQVLLRCCLIHKSIIILTHFLYLLHLCACLELSLFMSYLCDLFFIFIFIFTMINGVISQIQAYMLVCLFLRICPITLLLDNVVEE